MAWIRRKADKTSLLPEIVLITIVSFLPFKEAVRTSILSKRWSKIWLSTKNIEFNELFFLNPPETDATKQLQRRTLFFDFITHFMDNYRVINTVDKFSLKVSNPESCADIIERCVAFATERGVKELRLDFSDPTWEENEDDDNDHHDALFQLPNHVYRHASLEALELYACGFAMPDMCNLVELKDVSFGWIEMSTNTVKTLLSTLGKLENLSMKKCWNLEHFDMRTQEVGLRRLVIDKCHFVISDYVDLRAPNLKFLKYSGKLGIFEVKALPEVVQEAQLDFTPMPKFEEYGDELCQLLLDLSGVRVLTVCSFLLQALPTGEEQMRMQHDMEVRHLLVNTDLDNQELFGFVLLLSSCVYLEKLTLDIGQGKIYDEHVKPYPFDFAKFCCDQYAIFECVKDNLKVVEINGSRASKNELRLCFYLIQVGCVLEKLIINLAKEEGNEMLEIERHERASLLFDVPKASKNLQIWIV
ncbi:hypothetical protein JHK82_028699 [Glycine max]|uniref:Uncharacterized protein n=2 Tax=Glycine subgen. Soja TaxID=1462606 RepID=I1LCP6_SOYBN|nr:hypothetical protein JHK85_029362 [Glycine max]KAG5004680.1 hypothetical protein JHK86_028819 [Glycine max]KAG5127864.1 hypothetical protein JHK82_028699 [Glycine max]KAG5152473.1 hypothetical protein JHK84_028945 [Glycine max]KAH1139148.1 hypothetical protein GYH30_028552 [Glycine max]|eukprot:XP_006590189.2 putative F-box/LRR-repeat protein At5g54820 [Glycine max]